MKLLKYFIIAFILVVALIAARLTIVFDDPPVADSDLMPPEIQAVNDEDNASYYLDQANKVYVKPEKATDKEIENYLLGKDSKIEISEDIINKYLSANEKTLEFVDKAFEAKFFQANEVKPLAQLQLLDLFLVPPKDHTTLPRLAMIKGFFALKNNDSDSAVHYGINLVALGFKMRKTSMGVLEYLIGESVGNFGFNLLMQTIKNANFSSDKLLDLKNTLVNLQSSKEDYINALKYEYLADKNTVTGLKDGSIYEGIDIEKPIIQLNYHFELNKTINLFANYYRKVIAAANENNCEISNTEEDIEIFAGKSPLEMFMTENSIGKKLLATFAPTAIQPFCTNSFLENTMLDQISKMLPQKVKRT